MEEFYFEENKYAKGEVFIYGKEINFKYMENMPLKYNFDIDMNYEKVKYKANEIKNYLDKKMNISNIEINEEIIKKIIILEKGKSVKFKINEKETIYEIFYTKDGVQINFTENVDGKIHKGFNYQRVINDKNFNILNEYISKFSTERLKYLLKEEYKRKK